MRSSPSPQSQQDQPWRGALMVMIGLDWVLRRRGAEISITAVKNTYERTHCGKFSNVNKRVSTSAGHANL
jgi:hypothetical protein